MRPERADELDTSELRAAEASHSGDAPDVAKRRQEHPDAVLPEAHRAGGNGLPHCGWQRRLTVEEEEEHTGVGEERPDIPDVALGHRLEDQARRLEDGLLHVTLSTPQGSTV